MEDQTMSVSLKCFSCGCELQGDTEKKYKSGDLIKCQECGKLNEKIEEIRKPLFRKSRKM